MDKKFNKKAEKYVTDLKSEICDKIKKMDNTDINKVIEFIYEYPRLTFDKEDFVKRKRLKNSIPSENRCMAKKADNTQCTRKKKDNCDFCGTHSQSAPHGLICNNVDKKSIEVVTQDIKGITYYVDNMQNVYRDIDIIEGKENPKIIAKYEKNNGIPFILEFYS